MPKEQNVDGGRVDDLTNDESGDTESEGSEEEFDPERFKQKISQVNSEAKNLRRRLKEAEAKAQRLDEIEKAQMSEVDRLKQELLDAQSAAKKAELRALRLDVASRKKLPSRLAERLQGDTLEELEADADELIQYINPVEDSKGSSVSDGKPKERLSHRSSAGGKPVVDEDELLGLIRPS